MEQTTKQQIRYYTEVDSTNLEAKRLLQKAFQDNCDVTGTVLAAERQTSGRGRLGRQWESPEGTGLWFSVIMQPALAIEQASLYSFVAAVAVAEAIRQETNLPAEVKWPNDVLLQGKKICGILLELVPKTKTEYYVVVGIGVNVNQKASDFPEFLQGKASSLAIVSEQEVNRQMLLSAILQSLQGNSQLLEQQGFVPVRDKWKELSCVIGKEVFVQQQKESYSGIAEDIAVDGSLLVRTAAGIVAVTAGDVSLRGKDGGYQFL